MSQENLDLVSAMHAAFTAGDLDAMLELWDPECEYHAAIEQRVEGDAGVFRGHAGIRRWWAEIHEYWDELGTDVREVRETGDQVVVAFVIRGRGKSSGVVIESSLSQVFTARDGRCLTARDYFRRHEALAAAGL